MSYSRDLGVNQGRKIEMPLDAPHAGFEVADQKTVADHRRMILHYGLAKAFDLLAGLFLESRDLVAGLLLQG